VYFSFYRIITLVLVKSIIALNLIKMQIPAIIGCVRMHPFHIELVWRLSEFAFFVRLLR